jgi:hypothetical protein
MALFKWKKSKYPLIGKYNLIQMSLIFVMSIFSLLMMYWAASGQINFGTGVQEQLGQRLWFLGATLFFSLTQLLVWSDWKKRISFTIMYFVVISLVFIVIGMDQGQMSADSTGSPVSFGQSIWIAFDVNTSAQADLSLGINARLVADAITVLIPSVVFMICLFQMLYAGEADEFIKAFMEGIACVIFIWIYSTTGLMPI